MIIQPKTTSLEVRRKGKNLGQPIDLLSTPYRRNILGLNLWNETLRKEIR